MRAREQTGAAGGAGTAHRPDEARLESPRTGEELFGIGRVAADTGTSERTLRYYEELGLLRPAAHRQGGSRLYRTAEVERVRRIRELQDLMGFNLEEIKTIVSAEDRLDVLRGRYRSATGDRSGLVAEAIGVLEDLHSRVDAKLARLEDFRAQVETRLERLRPRAAPRG